MNILMCVVYLTMKVVHTIILRSNFNEKSSGCGLKM